MSAGLTARDLAIIYDALMAEGITDLAIKVRDIRAGMLRAEQRGSTQNV